MALDAETGTNSKMAEESNDSEQNESIKTKSENHCINSLKDDDTEIRINILEELKFVGQKSPNNDEADIKARNDELIEDFKESPREKEKIYRIQDKYWRKTTEDFKA